MERYAPVAKDLASRDVVSRSMTVEIREGRYVKTELNTFACITFIQAKVLKLKITQSNALGALPPDSQVGLP